MRSIKEFIWGPIGLLLLVVGLAGIPDDTTQWGRWVNSYVPFLQNTWVFTSLVGVAAISLSVFLGNIFANYKIAQDSGNPQIARLKKKSYVTFAEIADAISKTNEAYDYADIIRQLLRAAERGEFKTWLGRTRLWIQQRDKHMLTPQDKLLPIGIEELAATNEIKTGDYSPGRIAYERAVLLFAFRKEAGERTAGGAMSELILKRPEFIRWYRRFRNYRYER